MTMSTPSAFPGANGLGGLMSQTAEAAEALDSLKGPAQSAAKTIDEAFSRAGSSLALSLTRAAADGRISLEELARAVLEAINAASGIGSGGKGGGGLGDILSKVLIQSFAGARADGGPVTAGGAYLVGERGPELFRPQTSGMIDASSSGGSGGMTVNIAVSPSDAGLLRSDAKLAQAWARAVSLGARKL
jgi:phage-related minor tail protein